MADLAAIVRPFLRGPVTPESVADAVTAARTSWDDFFAAQMCGPRRHAALVDILSGTYDEFRAEAAR